MTPTDNAEGLTPFETIFGTVEELSSDPFIGDIATLILVLTFVLFTVGLIVRLRKATDMVSGVQALFEIVLLAAIPLLAPFFLDEVSEAFGTISKQVKVDGLDKVLDTVQHGAYRDYMEGKEGEKGVLASLHALWSMMADGRDPGSLLLLGMGKLVADLCLATLDGVLWLARLFQGIVIFFGSLFLPLMCGFMAVSWFQQMGQKFVIALFGVAFWPAAWLLVDYGLMVLLSTQEKIITGAVTEASMVSPFLEEKWGAAAKVSQGASGVGLLYMSLPLLLWGIIGYVAGTMAVTKMFGSIGGGIGLNSLYYAQRLASAFATKGASELAPQKQSGGDGNPNSNSSNSQTQSGPTGFGGSGGNSSLQLGGGARGNQGSTGSSSGNSSNGNGSLQLLDSSDVANTNESLQLGGGSQNNELAVSHGSGGGDSVERLSGGGPLHLSGGSAQGGGGNGGGTPLLPSGGSSPKEQKPKKRKTPRDMFNALSDEEQNALASKMKRGRVIEAEFI